MMSETELVERLTDIIKQQAGIICGLFNVVAQLDAVTSLEQDISAVQNDIRELGIEPCE